MVETVEESLLSIHSNTSEEYEILIVDDGSTDGSLDVLHRLESEYERVRVVQEDNDNIAQARNSSIEHSNGDFILHQLDADDVYNAGIEDFVKVFEALNDSVPKDVYLRGRNLHIAKRDLLLRISYQDVGYGEDLDLWRRLSADSEVEMIWLSHHQINEELGYSRSLIEYAQVRYSTAKVNFQTGITPVSYAEWMLRELMPSGRTTRPWFGAIFHLLITPLAYINAHIEGFKDECTYPDCYRNYSWYMSHILEEVRTLDELERIYGFDVSRELSEAGVEMFRSEPLPSSEETVP